VSEPCTWPYPAVATGIGPMPGVDSREAMNVAAGEFADFIPLVELPARGPGADPVGRTAALLAEVDRSFEVETTPSGWRLGHTGQRVLARARGYLSEDIDALEEFAAGSGNAVPIKVAIAGPWTLATKISDPAGEALLRDVGAVGDLTEALAQAASDLVLRLRRWIADDALVIQLDDDVVPRVLAGRVPMSSGRLTHRSVEPSVVQNRLRTVSAAIQSAGARVVIRCHAQQAPVDLLRDTGTDALAVDLGREQLDDDALPRAWEAGVGLLLGCVPILAGNPESSGSAGSGDRGGSTERVGDTALSARLRGFMSEHGFASVPANIAITPHGGLADISMEAARATISACARVGAVVRDEQENADVR